MAATDQLYRNQKTLNIVFALSCIAMFLSVIWMLVDDYNKPFKAIQREFRDVEETTSLVQMLASLPSIEAVQEASDEVARRRTELTQKRDKLAYDRKKLLADRDRADGKFQDIKALVDSEASYRDIDVEHVGQATTSAAREKAQKAVEARDRKIKALRESLEKASSELATANKGLLELERDNQIDTLERKLAEAEAYLKELTGKFDRFGKLAAEKRWKTGDTIRDLPILDGFASPTSIKQIVLEDLPIDYSFKHVTRYDRCATCHLGIENANLDRETLEAIGKAHEAGKLARNLDGARRMFEERLRKGETKQSLGFDPGDLPKSIKVVKLTPGQIAQYAAHPRLDLFVDSNSPHSAEKFGCTVCHAGQGSATSFELASHTPNDALQKGRWQGGGKDGYHWHSNHYWDYPMLPKRFAESSCLKCHHQVTDLVRHGTKEEAPRLLEGYNLVRENGCFGCHEIAGTKGGRPIGPDMRLEPVPPLEWLPVKDQLQAKADTLNPPGTLRKVGPSLRRTAEKSPIEFLASWIRSPRGFRPDTKMPHFYGLSTNSKEVLPEDQKDFPEAEIASIAYYLQTESRNALEGEDLTRRLVRLDLTGRLNRLQANLTEAGRLAEQDRTGKLDAEGKVKLSELRRLQGSLKKDIDGLRRRYRDLALMSRPTASRDINALGDSLQQAIDRTTETGLKSDELKSVFNQISQAIEELRKASVPAAPLMEFKARGTDGQLLKDKDGKEVVRKPEFLLDSKNREIKLNEIPGRGEAKDRTSGALLDGKDLFLGKGCLACHSHVGAPVEYSDPNDRELTFQELSEANFGPELSRIALKLNKDTDRLWLIQWILNPNVYHPRTRMPITHLKVEEAAAVADWLLSQKDGWKPEEMPKDNRDALERLAKLSLEKAPGIGRQLAQEVLDKGLSKEILKNVAADADEQLLVEDGNEKLSVEKLKRYIGKKAINRQGCFACHDIPGFEAAKPIGTALNDWGRKDAERLAFEDAKSYVAEHFNIATVREDPKNPGKPSKSWEEQAQGNKPVFEKFYQDAIKGHSREGFLALKLTEPRSYDYGRVRSWDDRLRMPQFKFSRTHLRKGDKKESIDEYKSRRTQEAGGKLDSISQYEEARSREAVMTFVLGLVAEPIPLKYVHNPKPERQAEIKGLQVLEKYNCAGCHEVRPGLYEFKVPEDKKREFFATLDQKDPSDHFFSDSTAWVGRPSPVPGRHFAYGVSPDDKEVLRPDPRDDKKKVYSVMLTEALRFTDANGAVKNKPAGAPHIDIPAEWVTSVSPTYGGDFARLVAPYLQTYNQYRKRARKDQVNDEFKARANQRAALPPQLIREGEKVQPGWLYHFLLDPHLVRPWAVLRMPKFNMSEEEARALTEYFAAVDKMTNPPLGLNESFAEVPQKDWAFWKARNQKYLADLGTDTEQGKKTKAHLDAQLKDLPGIWARYQTDELNRKKLELETARQVEKNPSKGDEEDSKKRRAAIEEQVKALEAEVGNVEKAVKDGKDYKSDQYDAFVREWRTEQVYATDAYKSITDKQSACVGCHSVGNMIVQAEKGPNLGLAAERLRPRWTYHWIANPARLSTVSPSMMSQNFPADKVQDPHYLLGSQREYAEASTDVLMNLPTVSKLPVNRYRLAPRGGVMRENTGDR